MILIDETIGSALPAFLSRLEEETLEHAIISYAQWASHKHCTSHDHDKPEGIILMRVLPEIAFNRIKAEDPSITLEKIKLIYEEKDQFYINNKNNPQELENLPVLVLNGNIDFQNDFSQFYNHLFYIRRFIKQIEEIKEVSLGIYKEKKTYRKCC